MTDAFILGERASNSLIQYGGTLQSVEKNSRTGKIIFKFQLGKKIYKSKVIDSDDTDSIIRQLQVDLSELNNHLNKTLKKDS